MKPNLNLWIIYFFLFNYGRGLGHFGPHVASSLYKGAFLDHSYAFFRKQKSYIHYLRWPRLLLFSFFSFFLCEKQDDQKNWWCLSTHYNDNLFLNRKGGRRYFLFFWWMNTSIERIKKNQWPCGYTFMKGI